MMWSEVEHLPAEIVRTRMSPSSTLPKADCKARLLSFCSYRFSAFSRSACWYLNCNFWRWSSYDWRTSVCIWRSSSSYSWRISFPFEFRAHCCEASALLGRRVEAEVFGAKEPESALFWVSKKKENACQINEEKHIEKIWPRTDLSNASLAPLIAERAP